MLPSESATPVQHPGAGEESIKCQSRRLLRAWFPPLLRRADLAAGVVRQTGAIRGRKGGTAGQAGGALPHEMC